MYAREDVRRVFDIVELKDAESGEGEPLPDGWAAIYKADSVYACTGMKTRKEARAYAAAFMHGIHYLGSKF